MDPLATLNTFNNWRLSASERVEAATDLLGWLAMGGYCPGPGGESNRRNVVDSLTAFILDTDEDLF